MIRKTCLIFWCLLPLFVVSQVNAPIESYVEAGRSLLYNNPQQGIQYFESLLERFPSMPDSTRGDIQANLGTGYAMRGNMDSARVHMLTAVQLLPEGNPRLYALKNLASVYRIQKQYGKADSIFTHTLQAIPESKATGNVRAMLLGEQAAIYMDQGQNKAAIQMLKQGLLLCQQSPKPDTVTLSILRNKLATMYMNTNNYSMAAEELERVVAITDPTTDLYNYCTTTSTLARALLESGWNEKASAWLDVALNSTRKLNNAELEGFVLMLFGKYEAALNHPEKAKEYFESSFTSLRSEKSDYLNDCATDYLTFLSRLKMYDRGREIIQDTVLIKLQESITSIDLLKFKRAALLILVHTSPSDQSLAAYEAILPLMDSVTKILLDQSLIDAKSEYYLQEKEQQRKELVQQNKMLAQKNQIRNAQFFLVIVAAIALLFVVLYLVLRHRNKTLRQQQELERTKQEVALREQRLKLESQLRTMREKVIQQQKTDLLSQVEEISKLKTELEKAADESHKSAEEAFARQLSETKNKIGLEQFLQQFNAIYPTFFSRLSQNYPSLSTSDLQFCALIRLNLSIKDISSILAIEPKSTYKKKYRIEEKMGLQPGEHLERVLMGVQEG